MLNINRIVAILKTENENYGFDYVIEKGLNLVSSVYNTRGKSSALLAIYYCLGFEEIVGGKGHKVLTSIYKKAVTNENGISIDVLESELWLEINNGSEVVTLYRVGKMENRNENLITVYFSNFNEVHDPKTDVEDMYIHSQRSTTSSKGFHTFLEHFIGLKLPLVPSNEGVEYKLYLQLIFSTIFIEQKRGWSDLFSAMPILGIRDAKKRVIEYILALDTLSNEKKRDELKQKEFSINKRWELITSEIQVACNRDNCFMHVLPLKPKLIEEKLLIDDNIIIIGKQNYSISKKIEKLQSEFETLKGRIPKIADNFENLQSELDITEKDINEFEEEWKKQSSLMNLEITSIHNLEESLEIINIDIQNNKDALKLKKMGSELQISSYVEVCPLCNQHIEDTLLTSQNCAHVMSIDENIRHLESQKTMILFALDSHRKNKNIIDENMQYISNKIVALRRLAKTIRNDLFSVDDNISETVVYKRIKIENEIQSLIKLKKYVEQKVDDLYQLAQEWSKLLQEKSNLPKANFSENDRYKIHMLEKYFKDNLKSFNYQSVLDYNSIKISFENYLPTSEGFDMKFDSSASDNIRAIWAYTIALLQTSVETKGNHPQILLFDEPAQHSIVTDDVISLFKTVVKIPGNNQFILGITVSGVDNRNAVYGFDKQHINIIDVGNHAFKVIK